MQHIIEIDEKLNEILEEVAENNNLSASQYAQNIVSVWLEGQYRGRVQDELKKSSLETLDKIKILAKSENKKIKQLT